MQLFYPIVIKWCNASDNLVYCWSIKYWTMWYSYRCYIQHHWISILLLITTCGSLSSPSLAGIPTRVPDHDQKVTIWSSRPLGYGPAALFKIPFTKNTKNSPFGLGKDFVPKCLGIIVVHAEAGAPLGWPTTKVKQQIQGTNTLSSFWNITSLSIFLNFRFLKNKSSLHFETINQIK